MRKVDLRVNEQHKYEIIKKLVDTCGSKERAALQLRCSKRTVNRMIAGYKSKGKAFFIHGNRGRKPIHTLSNDQKELICQLYLHKYPDANLTHFVELLDKNEGIAVSHGTVRKLLAERNILSPKAHKKTIRQLKKKLKNEREIAKSKREIKSIDKAMLQLQEAHPRRPRAPHFGELIQMDASVHYWFGPFKTFLHIAIDDATGWIVGAWFDKQETLNGYYNVFYQILTSHGIPYKFFTDNRTIFEFKKKNNPSIEKDHFTQFAYACHQLGVELKTSSVPQAKGRVERVFQTLQSRLPVELRLAGVTDVAAANQFLNSYIKEFNERFGLPADNIKSVFEKQPSEEQINLILAVITNRTIDAGHCIRYDSKYFMPVNAYGNATHYLKGTKAVVIRAFDGRLFAAINDVVYSLDEITKHEWHSKNFGVQPTKKEKKERYIPTASHPWRPKTLNTFMQKNIHHFEHNFEDSMYTQENYYK